MEKLYYSRGISKRVSIVLAISLVLSLILAVITFALMDSKVDGPTQLVSIGGGANHLISLKQNRFNSDERSALYAIGVILLASVILEAGVLVLYMRSWTEIYKDSIKANSMGKIVACKMSDITDVTIGLNGHVVVSIPTGKIRLITKDPTKAQSIITDLLLKR